MNLTFCCPKCDQSSRLEVSQEQTSLDCPNCQSEIRFPAESWSSGQLHRCIVCPSQDLYVRKDFPQRVGVGLVAIGVIGSSIAWYYQHVFLTFGILFATALIDVLLFFVVGNALMCYRCFAQYRGLEDMDTHSPFDLETHERYRQAAARQADPPRRSDSAAVSSEHTKVPETQA